MEAVEIVKNQGNGTLEAINKVQTAICDAGGISKDNQAPREAGGFAFRGVDDLYNYLGPQVASFGLVLKSFKVTKHTVNFVASKKGQKLHWVVVIKWTFGCTHDDSTAKYVTVGEAMDAGDKGLNKAITSAFKNLIFPLFIIPVETKQDSEHEKHELGTANMKLKDHKGWENAEKILLKSPHFKTFNMSLEEIKAKPHDSWNSFWKLWSTHVEKQKKQATQIQEPVAAPTGAVTQVQTIQEHANYDDLTKFLKDYNLTDRMNNEHKGWDVRPIQDYEQVKNDAWKLSQH